MSEEIYNRKKTKEEQEQLEYLISKSAKQLPDKPSDYGKTPVDIKKALYEPSQILFDYLLYYYYKNKAVGDELTTKNESVIAYQRLKTDIQSGILTIENYNLSEEKIGESSINLNKANVGFTFEVDHENNRLVINFADGSTQYIDFAELIAQDQFASSATIEVARVNGAYTFNLSDNALRKLIIELSPEELETLITNNEVEHNKLYLVGGSRFSEEEAGTNNVIETLELLQNRITQLENKVSSVYSLKGSLDTYQDLIAIENPSVGDVYNVIGEGGMNYVYTANETWDALGGIVDLSHLLTKQEGQKKLYPHRVEFRGYEGGLYCYHSLNQGQPDAAEGWCTGWIAFNFYSTKKEPLSFDELIEARNRNKIGWLAQGQLWGGSMNRDCNVRWFDKPRWTVVNGVRMMSIDIIGYGDSPLTNGFTLTIRPSYENWEDVVGDNE